MKTCYKSAILSVFLGLGVASCSTMPNLSLPGTQQQHGGTTTAANVPQALPNHQGNHASGAGANYHNASYSPNTSATENYSYANYGANNSGSGSYYDNYDSYSNQNNAGNSSASSTHSGTGGYYDNTTGSNYDYNPGTATALPGGAYAVQILATMSSGKANDLQRQMENMGYPAVVDFIDGLHKVRVPYQSKAQAHAHLDSIRSAANEPQAFVATR